MDHDGSAHTIGGRAGTVALVLCALALVIALGARILGPSDLHQNQDQTKTIAFTADTAFNGEWMLPRDGSGDRARKPPLVNWIGVPFVRAGWHSELAYKMPALVSGALIAIVTALMSRWMYRRLAHDDADPGDRMLAAGAPIAGVVAGVAWVASPSSVKQVYFLRPDIVMAAFLTLAWVCATVVITTPDVRRRWAWNVGLWVCAGLAGLAKGPMALLVVAYVVLLSVIVGGRGGMSRTRRFMRTGWWWGIPVMVVIPLGWLYGAWRVDPEHVEGTILGYELGERVVGGEGRSGPGSMKMLFALVNVPAMFGARFGAWAVLAALAIVFRPSSRWATHAMGPAAVWVALVMVVNVLIGGSANSFLIPAYPAAATLAVYAGARLIAGAKAQRARWAMPTLALLAVLTAAGAGAHEVFTSRAARTGEGNAIVAFARTANAIVGDDAVVFVGVGDNPVSSLMGRHHSGEPEGDALARAAWVVTGFEPEPAPGPEAVSDPVAKPVGVLEARSSETVRLRLYRRGALPAAFAAPADPSSAETGSVETSSADSESGESGAAGSASGEASGPGSPG